MGCASSNPIVQSGKHFVESAKDSATEAVNKGEHILHDVEDAAKEGMGHVKDTVETTLTMAESGFDSMVEKVHQTFSSGKNEAEEVAATAAADAAAESKQAVKKIEQFSQTPPVETVTEVVSEAETVLLDNENETEFMAKVAPPTTKMMSGSLTDEFGEVISADAKESVNDALRIEDVEESTLDAIDTNVKDMKKKAEDLVNGLSEPAGPEETKEDKPPTFWEAAADAILYQRILRALPKRRDSFEDDVQGEDEAPSSVEDISIIDDRSVLTEEGKHPEGEPFRKEHIPPPEIIISSENLSVKSYKSEI